MYCPNCAASNPDATKFCRACGVNLSLVPQALTGELPGSRSTDHQKRHENDDPPSIESGISKFFMGIGFLLVSAAVFFYAPAGKIWWFWMLLPAFGMLGKGIAEIVTVKMSQGASYHPTQTQMPPVADRVVVPPRTTGEIIPPPSVTEATTRHLDSTAESYKENR